MKKNLLQRVIIIAVVTLLALLAIFWPGRTPTRNDFTAAGINNILRQNINLGLDLRGGSHLVMQVQVQDYLRRLTENVANGIQTAARDQGFDIKEARPEVSGDAYRVVVTVNDKTRTATAEELHQAYGPREVRLAGGSGPGTVVAWILLVAFLAVGGLVVAVIVRRRRRRRGEQAMPPYPSGPYYQP